MQLFKRILLGLAALTIVSIFALIIYFWPIDSRLSGTFKSNKDATISYLQATRKLTDRQRHVFDQMYGHLSYKFDGHRLKTIMEPHVVRGYGREDLYIEKEITEFYFFVKKSDKNSATIVVLPTPFWIIENAKIIQLEFDTNGFWIEAELLGLRFIEPPFKEKFNKIS